MQGTQQLIGLEKLLKIFRNMEDKMANQNIIDYNEMNPKNDKYFKQKEKAQEVISCSIVLWTYDPNNSEKEITMDMDCYASKEDLESLKGAESPAFIQVQNDVETLLIPTAAIIEISY